MRGVVLFFLLLFAEAVYPQVQPGKWRDHFSYNNGVAVCQGESKIYCATPTGIFWYNKSDGQIGKISRVNGLSDIDISTIEYSPQYKTLAVGYEDGNVDFVFKDRVLNISEIKKKLLQGSKKINGFTFYNNLVFVSTDFGIVVIDIDKEEIKDTYYIGDLGEPLGINRTVVFNGRVYAATKKGLLSANVNDPLLIHYLSWSHESGFTDPAAECVDIDVFGQKLIVVEGNPEVQKDILWAYDGYTWGKISEPYNTINHVRADQSRFIATSKEGVSIYSSIISYPTTIAVNSSTNLFDPDMAVPIGQTEIAVADHYSGISFGEVSGLQQIRPNGPLNNRAFSIGVSREKVIVAAGAYDASFSNRWYPLSFHRFENEQWQTYEDGSSLDAVRVVFNPANPNEFYIASWGWGIFQCRNNEIINHYTQANSTLQSIYPSDPYCRISGVALDRNGNLWATNVMVANPISVRKTDGKWYSFPYANAINSDRLSDLYYSPSGQLWLILPSGEGLFVLDPGSNVESASDDKYRKIKLTDKNGNLLPNDIYALAFDHDGYLWIGTSEGVLTSYNPEKVLNATEFLVQKVKIPDVVEGLAAYLLETETVTSVSVDGGNRKWFGTSKSGVYLQSEDGSKMLKHFTTTNSPLPSNSIVDIKIHPTSGEVFIATEKGLISYRGEATEASEKFGKVYAFPNPVKPNYNGVIVITGLVESTTVKITDISGNLVYETQSMGGQATWDGKNLNGHKVATGVYLIFCSDSKGDQTEVSKLLFVK